MGMVVRSNIMAINANRSLGVNNSMVAKNLEKLSSGFKINRAADDAAGLAISEKMKAQIKGLEQASLNSQDGISLVQTAEGALTEVHDMLNRMKELATKSSNGTIQDDVDRDAIQNEVNKLNDEIDRISQSTNFNGINLLDGSLSAEGGAGGASNIKLGSTGMTLTDVDATKNSFTAQAAISIGTFATAGSAGDTVTYTVSLDNGKSYTIDLVFDAENKTFNVNGKTYGSTADTNKFTLTEVADAFVAAFKDTDLGKDYKISHAGGTLSFNAKVAGAATPDITGLNNTYHSQASVGVAATQAAVTIAVDPTIGHDAFQQVEAMNDLTVFDGTNAKDAIFTVNGKQFAIVASNALDSVLSKLEDGVTIIRLTDASIDESDALIIAAEINNQTGLSIGADGDTGEIKFFNTDASGGVNGTGGLTLQIGDTGDEFNRVTVSVQDMSATGIGTKGLDVNTQDAAKDAINIIKEAINYVSTNRSELGALQNRLEHTINNLDVAAENMTSANSRIRDTDMAKQMMEYTKMNVLTQSAQAMLAQANQQPQSILQLLQ